MIHNWRMEHFRRCGRLPEVSGGTFHRACKHTSSAFHRQDIKKNYTFWLINYVQLLHEGATHRRRGYWFPYWFKLVAWCITLGGIATCSTYLALYGLTFGLLKCYLWLTAVILSVIISNTFVQPIKIFVISSVLSTLIKSPPTLQLKRLPKEILENPYDEIKAFRANRLRLDNASLYKPVPAYKLQSRAENIKYHLEQRKLFVEVSIYVVFVFALVYLVSVHRSWAVYYSTDVVKHLVVLGSYTNTIPFTQVTSYRQFIEYLNETLFPSLFGSTHREVHTTGMNDSYEPFQLFGNWFRKKKTRKRSQDGEDRKVRGLHSLPQPTPVWGEENLHTLRQLHPSVESESQKNVTHIYERSWTLDRSVKMIGKPRMRQLRVKNNSCSISRYIKPREDMCFSEYKWCNQEMGNFSLWWDTLKDETLTPSEQMPWIYQNAWSTGAIGLVGKHSSYPAGGYILEFAKHLDDCRVILEYMDSFQWIDARTRVVVIEFALYSVNVNLFNVIHLIVERSATGYFITSYQIDTAKFMFLASELEVISICVVVIFTLLILLFAFRQALRVERTSFHSYILKGNPIIDILIVIFGLIAVAFIFLRSYYVSSLLNTLERSQNNAFVSFAYAAVWSSIQTYILAALVTLTAVKLFQILRFRVVFLQLQETLRGSYRYFFSLSVQLFIVLMAFSMFFHLLLASYDYQFSTLAGSLSKLIGLIACLSSTCDTSVYDHTPWFLAPLFYALYLLSILTFITSFFVAVICYYLGRIKNTQIENKYNALAYLKHILTANEKSDILRLRGGYSAFDDSSPLRLRGGGSICSRICLGDQKTYEFPPKYKMNNVVIKRGEPMFTRVKIYDLEIPYRVNDLRRFETMRRLTKAELTTEGPDKEVHRETAMKLITVRGLYPCNQAKRKRDLPEEFYRGRDINKKWVISTETLLEMRRITDAYGREKLFKKYSDAGLTLKIIEDYEEDNSHLVSTLDKKMLELQTVVDENYKEERKRKREERRSSATKKKTD